MRKSLFYGFLFCFLCAPLGRADRIYILIDKAQIKKSYIAIPPFLSQDESDPVLGEKIRAVVEKDLEFTRFFQILPSKLYFDGAPIEGITRRDINFLKWNALGTEFLIKGTYKVRKSEITLESSFYDVMRAEMIGRGIRYTADLKDWRTLGHKYANEIVQRLTGSPGIFQTKIAFVSDRTGHKEIYVMDYDGENPQQLTFHRSISLAPSWSPDGKEILYSSYTRKPSGAKNLDLFRLQLTPGRRTLLSSLPGLNVGGKYAPNGEDIAVTMSFEGDPEIYLINKEGKNIRRLTNSVGVDVEPSWSADGKSLVFSSGRAPLAHLYMMNADGTSVKRLTFAGIYNASPSWSPQGTMIAFAGQAGEGSFDLFLVQSDGKALRRLTLSQGKREDNENPSWSPDGRSLVFSSTKTGRSEIYLIHADGSGEVRLTKNFGACMSPVWSP